MELCEIQTALDGQIMLVDSREQNTPRLRYRLKQMDRPHERKALNFGDYSCKFPLPDGEWLTLEDKCVIERKESLDEICNNFCRNRDRFKREFERAEKTGARVYLLIENADWTRIFNHEYRSKMSPQALQASLLAWLARYDCKLITCRPEESGIMIRDILLREGKERMLKLCTGKV